MKRLVKEQILAMHEALIRKSGGSLGLLDEALLDSALNAPFQSFDNTSVFPSIQQKAVRLGYGLIRNHAFIDGNKRVGTHAMLIFLEMNGIELHYESEELYEMTLFVSNGDFTFENMLQWVLEHQSPD